MDKIFCLRQKVFCLGQYFFVRADGTGIGIENSYIYFKHYNTLSGLYWTFLREIILSISIS